MQTGIGRTGKMFSYQHYGITPDVMTLAKGLGGGLPIGVMVVRNEFSDLIGPGMHASTFGGGPVICKAALGVLRAIQKEKLLKNCQQMGEYLLGKLNNLKNNYALIKEIRGKGLMLGMELNLEGKQVVQKCMEQGLVITLHVLALPTCVLPSARYVCAVPASVAVKALHTGTGAVPALAGVGFS